VGSPLTGFFMSEAYDPQNVFAQILAGKIPCVKVYEDAKTFAFMDIMPRAEGHTLVIPKAPARNILDIGVEDLQAVIATVQRIAGAAKLAMGAEGVTINQYNESAGGQVVFHLHFHVIPRREGDALRPPASFKADPAALQATADKIVAALGRV
jgi:histidine triad (HIT) family protein